MQEEKWLIEARQEAKEQENAIFDAKIKHDVSVDLGILGY